MVAEVGRGRLSWVSLLATATGTATARRAVGRRAVRIADAVAGTGLLAFGCALAASAA
jgi:predicted RNA methylase